LGLRPISPVEEQIVHWFAKRVADPQGQSLLWGLDTSTVEEVRDEHLSIMFHLKSYARPPGPIVRPVPVDAMVQDADGAKLAATLFTDENGRLLELEVLRFEPGPVLRPDWATLRELRPDEIVRLGTLWMDS
jgi:hypothetical protein